MRELSQKLRQTRRPMVDKKDSVPLEIVASASEVEKPLNDKKENEKRRNMRVSS
jgi:hypothetical protein